jgi:hypothetical protein
VGHPCGLKEEPLLRVHEEGFIDGDVEALGVKEVHVGEEGSETRPNGCGQRPRKWRLNIPPLTWNRSHRILQRAILLTPAYADRCSVAREHDRNKALVPGTFREHSGNIQGTFREHSGNVQGTFREHAGNMQGTRREHAGNMQRNIQATLKEHLRLYPRDASGAAIRCICGFGPVISYFVKSVIILPLACNVIPASSCKKIPRAVFYS